MRPDCFPSAVPRHLLPSPLKVASDALRAKELKLIGFWRSPTTLKGWPWAVGSCAEA